MKFRTATLLGIASTSLAIVGCAIPPMSMGGADSVVDEAKIAGIDRAAKRLGVTVVWINLPRKTVTVTGS